MLIGITGSKGSGKDTFAEVLVDQGFHNVKQADVLKEMLRTLYRMAGEDHETIERKLEGDLKEEPCTVLGGATPRHAMQSLGTEWRNMIDENLWVNIWHERTAALLDSGASVVCTDVRFSHEAEAVKQLGGTLVRIDRPGTGGGDQHSSETEMTTLPVDETIGNTGSIDDLQQKAINYLEERATMNLNPELQENLTSYFDEVAANVAEMRTYFGEQPLKLTIALEEIDDECDCKACDGEPEAVRVIETLDDVTFAVNDYLTDFKEEVREAARVFAERLKQVCEEADEADLDQLVVGAIIQAQANRVGAALGEELAAA